MFTYSNSSGATTCQKCPPSEYSLEGATKCQIRPNCTKDDFFSYYTPCDKNTRTLKYELKHPLICNLTTTDPASIPKDKTQLPCPQCPAGLYRDITTNKCVRCGGEKQYWDSKLKKCASCPAGEAALKYARYDHDFFADSIDFPSNWQATCHGSCSQQNRGWIIVNDPVTLESYLQSGGGVGHGEMTTLTFSTRVSNLYVALLI
jgi:hypothetical protein